MKIFTPAPEWSAIRRTGVAALTAAGSALFTTLLLSLWRVDGVPGGVTILLLGLATLSAWRPGAALMALAAGVPVATWIGRTWNGAVAWPETLAVAFAAGYLARSIWTSRPARDELHLPVFAFAGLVIASLAVRLLVLHWTIGGEALWLQLRQLAAGDYFIGSGGFRDLDAAMRLIEGMVLLRAASSLAQDSPAFAPRLVRWFVVGAAAAAALNLWRVWQGALRLDEPVEAFIRYMTTLRYNVHYADVNAAGSYFVLGLFVAVGLTIAAKHIRWMGAALLIATSLMLSGSRAASVAGAVAVIVWVAWRLKGLLTGRNMRSWVLAAVALLLVVSAMAAVSNLLARRNLTPSSTALNIRAEFVLTTLRMIGAHPAFGIGIGRYPERSSSYSSPVLVESYELGQENAHNNFLQILGELGILGLAALLWMLWRAGRRSLRAPCSTADPLHEGMMMGLLAFVLTWLSGHPLLIDEPALMFWLVLGTAAGCGGERPPGPWVRQESRLAAAVAIASIAVAVLVPLRARQEIANTDLEHQGIGLSVWHHGDDGSRYRLAQSWSTVFIPSNARALTIPLRSAQPGTELLVSLRLNGRPADVVRVPWERWYDLHLILPSERNAPRFSRLELRVNDDSSTDAAPLMIGKVERR